MRHSKIFISFLYLCPLICYYLLPSTYEDFISIDIGYFSFFVPEFSIIILLFLRKNKQPLNSAHFNFLKISILVMIMFGLVSCADTRHVYTLYACTVMLRFFSVILFCFYFSIKESLMGIVKYFILGLFLILSFEIIVFSFGLLSWVIPLSSSDYGNVQRINSTIGAATGTAMVYYLLSIWAAELFYNNKKILLFIIINSCITMTVTMTRSGVLMILLLFLIFIAKYLFSTQKSLKSKINLMVSTGLLLAIIIFSVEKFGILDSFQRRIENAQLYDAYNDDYAGRYVRAKQAIDFIADNPLIGVSPGHFHVREKYAVNNIGYGAPHNSYLLFATEYGLIPSLFFFFSFFLILFRIIKYMPNSIVANGLIVFSVVGMNTESVIVEYIAWYYLLFLMMSYYFWKTYKLPSSLGRRIRTSNFKDASQATGH